MCCANLLSSSVAVLAFCAPTPAAHAYLGARNFAEAAHRSLPLAQSCDAAPSPCRPRGIRQDIIRRFDRARVSRHHSCVPVARRDRGEGLRPCVCTLLRLWGTAACSARGAAVYVHYVRSRSLVHRLRYNFLHTCKVGLTRPTHDTQPRPRFNATRPHASRGTGRAHARRSRNGTQALIPDNRMR